MTGSKYSVEEEDLAVWVYLEHDQGQFKPVSMELLAKGRELSDQMGWNLIGMLLGHRVGELAEEAVYRGADQVMVGEHHLLTPFTIEGHVQAAYQLISAHKPSVFFVGATPNGRDLAGRLAVRLRTGLNADCTGLQIRPDSGVLVCEVSGFGGGVLALIEMKRHRPQMATIRPGVFTALQPDRGRSGKINPVTIELQETDIRVRVVEKVTGEAVDLTQAPVIVAGGRGVEGDFGLMERLARLLKGEVGATRPPVDDGFIERERQIGQTGVICRPKVAIACGISGAFHFIVGIENADTVIAINSDPEAPIFEVADYCIVDDVSEYVPVLIQYLSSCLEIEDYFEPVSICASGIESGQSKTLQVQG